MAFSGKINNITIYSELGKLTTKKIKINFIFG